MRLLIFSISYKPFVGGAEIALENILARIGTVSPTIITARLDSNLPENEQIGSATVYRVGKGRTLDKYTYIFNAVRLAKKLHTKETYHVVQALMANYAGIAALFFKYSHPSVPYLLTLQSGDSPFFIWIRTFWFFPLYKRVYTKANYVQSISKYLLDRATRYGYKGPASIIPNGVDVQLFSHEKSNEEIAALKIELGIEKGEKVIITTSRLVHKNAIDQLIIGFHDWTTKAKIPAKLIIVGEGKLEKRLCKLIKKLQLKKSVIIVKKIKSHTTIPLYLQTSDVFVRTSRSEGMGNSFIEALAAGIPIIGTPVGGIVDFLSHRETGLVVDKDNPYAISRAIHELVTNPELSRYIVKNGKELILKKYQWDDIAGRMEKLYIQLASV
jgi:glycosyltransferase involved in cell wall biosynthesis